MERSQDQEQGRLGSSLGDYGQGLNHLRKRGGQHHVCSLHSLKDTCMRDSFLSPSLEPHHYQQWPKPRSQDSLLIQDCPKLPAFRGQSWPLFGQRPGKLPRSFKDKAEKGPRNYNSQETTDVIRWRGLVQVVRGKSPAHCTSLLQPPRQVTCAHAQLRPK